MHFYFLINNYYNIPYCFISYHIPIVLVFEFGMYKTIHQVMTLLYIQKSYLRTYCFNNILKVTT